MPDEIELQAKGDHDLLIMVVMQSNEMVRHLELMNGAFKKHLENHNGKPINLSKKQAISLGSAMIVVGGFIVGVIERLL